MTPCGWQQEKPLHPGVFEARAAAAGDETEWEGQRRSESEHE